LTSRSSWTGSGRQNRPPARAALWPEFRCCFGWLYGWRWFRLWHTLLSMRLERKHRSCPAVFYPCGARILRLRQGIWLDIGRIARSIRLQVLRLFLLHSMRHRFLAEFQTQDMSNPNVCAWLRSRPHPKAHRGFCGCLLCWRCLCRLKFCSR